MREIHLVGYTFRPQLFHASRHLLTPRCQNLAGKGNPRLDINTPTARAQVNHNLRPEYFTATTPTITPGTALHQQSLSASLRKSGSESRTGIGIECALHRSPASGTERGLTPLSWRSSRRRDRNGRHPQEDCDEGWRRRSQIRLRDLLC
jgi:hypothetical protein